MILLGIIDMARIKNINNKEPDVIAQYLKQHMKRLPSVSDVESVTNPDGTPPQPKDSEVKKMFEGRLHRNLTKSNKRR